MERKVLGRGLEALIPTDANMGRERVQTLKLVQIRASKYQPRLNFSESKLKELAESIRQKGVIQPILVRSLGADEYELIAGERRLRAVKHLGLDEIPAIVRRVADADVLEMAIIENIQREELSPVEEAKAYRRLSSEFGITQDSIALRVGKDKSTISNLLRLLSLPEKIQDYLTKNAITFGHAKALLSFSEEKRQLLFCEEIIRKGLSVRQAEALSQAPKRSARRTSNLSYDLQRFQDQLQQALGTKVRIKHGKKRGSIEIDYYSLEDLDRLLKRMGIVLTS